MLTFPVSHWGGTGPVITFLQGETPISAATTTYTFNSVNIGAAAADRYVLVCIGSFVSATGRTLSGVTIGGSAANIHCNIRSEIGASSDMFAIIAGLLVTSGTTTTVVATFSGNMTSTFCQVFTMRGAATPTSPYSAGTSGSNASVASVATSVNVPQGGALLATGGYFQQASLTLAGSTSPGHGCSSLTFNRLTR